MISSALPYQLLTTWPGCTENIWTQTGSYLVLVGLCTVTFLAYLPDYVPVHYQPSLCLLILTIIKLIICILNHLQITKIFLQ